MIGATNRAKNWRLDCSWRLTGLQAVPEPQMLATSCPRGRLARAGGSGNIHQPGRSRLLRSYSAEGGTSGRPRGAIARAAAPSWPASSPRAECTMRAAVPQRRELRASS
jgi:hypothetical protein